MFLMRALLSSSRGILTTTSPFGFLIATLTCRPSLCRSSTFKKDERSSFSLISCFEYWEFSDSLAAVVAREGLANFGAFDRLHEGLYLSQRGQSQRSPSF
jgi:hypothetical protein